MRKHGLKTKSSHPWAHDFILLLSLGVRLPMSTLTWVGFDVQSKSRVSVDKIMFILICGNVLEVWDIVAVAQ